MASGVFWKGSNGQVYVKGHKGTNAAGAWNGGTLNYWRSRGFTFIADPNPPKPTVFPTLQKPIAIAPTYVNKNSSPAQQAAQRAAIAQATARNAAIQRENERIAAENRAREAARQAQLAREAAARADLASRIRAMADKFNAQKNKREIINKIATRGQRYEDLSAEERIKNLARDEAYWAAKGRVNPNGSLFDMLTGGFGSELEAKKWAQAQQGKLQEEIKKYEKSVQAFYGRKASLEQQIAAAAARKDAETYKRLVAEYNTWGKKTQAQLMNDALKIEGKSKGYEKYSNSQLESWAGQVGKWIDAKNNPISWGMSNLFKYTLGNGDENLPSLVTAPSRVATALTNLTRKKGDTIYNRDGTQTQYNGDAWKTTLNQRNLNVNPTAPKFDDWALNKYKNMKAGQIKQDPFSLKKNSGKFDRKEYEKWVSANAKSLSQEYNRFYKHTTEAQGFAQDIALDPLSYSTGAVGKWIGRAAGATSTTVKATQAWNKLSNTKFGQAAAWLNKPYESTAVQIKNASKVYQDKKQELINTHWAEFHKRDKVIKNNQILYKHFDDLDLIDDADAAILQRMVSPTKFALRDAVKLRGAANAQRREFLLNVMKNQQRNANVQFLADNIGSSRFVGRYWAKGSTPRGAEQYNFRKFRKNDHVLPAKELRTAQIERYMLSAVDDVTSDNAGKVNKAQEELGQLLDDYNRAADGNAKEFEAVYKRLNSRGRKLWAMLGLPQAVWKASVLALRPAWYVNNAGYNAAAGMMAAGPGYAIESMKMLRPGALRQARKDAPSVTGQIEGMPNTAGNMLYKPGALLEDSNRLAAYKALLKQGYSEEDALKRVESYFFNHTPKNIERPFKSAMPFIGWTKGTAKLATRMPFDNPRAAQAYNTNEDNNQRERAKLPDDMKWLADGRQYIGTNEKGEPMFMNTPWNPFMSGNFSQVSLNPFMAAFGELSRQRDYYGNELDDKTIWGVFADKFPQAKLVRKAFKAYKLANGDLDTAVRYFSEPNSDGVRFTKMRQGKDSSKGSYSSKLDPSKGLADDIWGFAGRPRVLSFERDKYERQKALTKLNDEFFSIDWEKEYPDWDARRAAQEALADRYGYDLQKDLYDGYWSKNDTPMTAQFKKQKNEAASYADSFWAEYWKQPKGSRSIWVNKRMKEIVDQGLLMNNPFLRDKLPDWYSPDSVAKAERAEFWQTYFAMDKAGRRRLLAENPQYNKYNYTYQPSQKKIDYLTAKSTGDWSSFNAKYGYRTEKQRLYAEAKQTGDWGKFWQYADPAKHASYLEKRKASEFWKKYFAADKPTKKRLLAENPQYDKFAGQEPKTQEEWDAIMLEVKRGRVERVRADATGGQFYDQRLTEAAAAKQRGDWWLDRSSKKLTYK